jgi:PAS domain S-box-containing protein
VQVFWILLAWPGMTLAAAIEERKCAEETLLRGQQRYELATAAGHVAVWSYDYRTREVSADRALLTMLGYGAAGETRSVEHWLNRVHPEDLEPILARDNAITSTDAPRNAAGETPIPPIQYRMRCADGSFRWLSNSGTLYRDGGTPALAIGTVTDISDLKRAQDASLARQKLESLGVLVGGIAHDFNNLLGSIHVQAELAELSGEEGRFPYAEIRTIKTISLRASEIVRQLMLYAGHEKSDFEPVDLSRLVAEMLALLRVSISKSAVLETDLDPELPAVLGNEAQIRQVVMNLVLNASDALGTRSGAIRVSTTMDRADEKGTPVPPTSLPGGQHVKLVVSDTGSGISREAQARIFDPFFTTKSSGRGLGLAVVHGIVRAHNGEVYLDSVPGRGTTFQVLWPVAPASAAAPRGDSILAAPMERSATLGTVLIVEDEAVLRMSIARMLRKEGFGVMEAGDGSAALELFRKHSREIDVVLLDVTIPGTSSQTVVAEAAKIRADVQILLTSAYNRDVAAAAVHANQVCGFVRKPYRLRDVTGSLQEALATRRKRASSNGSR